MWEEEMFENWCCTSYWGLPYDCSQKCRLSVHSFKGKLRIPQSIKKLPTNILTNPWCIIHRSWDSLCPVHKRIDHRWCETTTNAHPCVKIVERCHQRKNNLGHNISLRAFWIVWDQTWVMTFPELLFPSSWSIVSCCLLLHPAMMLT